VGVARTVTVRAARPPAEDAEAVRARRFAYLDHLAAADAPTISVVECLDDGQEGFGSFWGEVNSAIHKALGCIGTVTNGSVRDIDALAEGFHVLAGEIGPSHGYVHVVDFGGTVSIAGMQVASGDLVHADRHGAVTLPRGQADEVLEAAALIARREAVTLKAARAKGATIESIKQAMLDAAKVG
jgi:regulator of RNase E activity RraA